MKEEKYTCDVCKIPYEVNYKNVKMQVIFESEQNEGRKSPPYFNFVNLDLCVSCMNTTLAGYYIFASGAMGHNTYYNKATNKTN